MSQPRSPSRNTSSHGLVILNRKSRSFRNRLRHGVHSRDVVLPHESSAAFEALRDLYLARFRPADQPEHDLVETMAIARWRWNRLIAVENKFLDKELRVRSPETANAAEDTSEVEKLASIFERSANRDPTLRLILRYEAHLSRTCASALKQLQTLQGTRPREPHPAAMAIEEMAPGLDRTRIMA